MPVKSSHSRSANHILSHLSRDDFRLLEPHLQAVDLPVRKSLETPKKRIDQVYFLERGLASVVAGSGQRSIEVGIIGREGMTGLSVLLGFERAPHAIQIQVAGEGLRISTDKLRHAHGSSPQLQLSMLRYAHTFLLQTTMTALANGRSKVEERLARWLLMAGDRIEGDELPLTPESLSQMLGTDHPGVTLAVDALAKARLITATHDGITILNRRGLETASNGIYIRPGSDERS